MKQLKVLVVTISFVLLSSPCRAERLDFDSDGVSDLTFVKIAPSGELNWRFRSSKSDRSRDLASLGQTGNHLVIGSWSNSATPEIGVISQDGTTKNILWSLEKRDGTKLSFTFGKTNDLAVSGADFDGNGLLDAAAIEIRNTLYYWKINFNPLGTSSTSEVLWGHAGDTPFFFKGTGAVDQLAVLRKNADNTATVFLKDAVSGSESSFTLNRPIGSVDTPMGISKGAVNYLLVPEKKETTTKISIFRSNGTILRTLTLRGTGDLVVGNFMSSQLGTEIGIKNGTSFTVINPFTKLTRSFSIKADVAVDDININALSTWGSGGNGGGGGNGGACTSKSPNDGYKVGFTWKPNSDTQYYAVAVMPASYTGKISKFYALKSDGTTVIKEIGLKNCGNPDPAGPRCNYQDRTLTGSDYKRLYGSIVLKAVLNDGSCVTYAIANPAQRTD